MYDMEEFLSKNGSVTILLFCFLLSLNIVFHILDFWKSDHEYSRKKRRRHQKGTGQMQRSVHGIDLHDIRERKDQPSMWHGS